MRRKLDDRTVEIIFQSSPPDLDEEDNPEQQIPEEYQGMLETGFHDFTVTVVKDDSQGAGIVAEFVASDGECKLWFTSFSKNVQVKINLSKIQL